MQDSDVVGIVNLQKNDWQVARNPQRPKGRLWRGPGKDLPRGRAQPGVAPHHHPAQGLKIGRVAVRDAKVAQLHLSLRPCQGGRTCKGRRVAVAVDKVQKCVGRFCDHGPECDAGHPARRNADPAADRKDRVKHGADRARQGCARHRRIAEVAPAADKAGTVGLDLDRRGLGPFDHGDMGGPDLGVLR